MRHAPPLETTLLLGNFGMFPVPAPHLPRCVISPPFTSDAQRLGRQLLGGRCRPAHPSHHAQRGGRGGAHYCAHSRPQRRLLLHVRARPNPPARDIPLCWVATCAGPNVAAGPCREPEANCSVNVVDPVLTPIVYPPTGQALAIPAAAPVTLTSKPSRPSPGHLVRCPQPPPARIFTPSARLPMPSNG